MSALQTSGVDGEMMPAGRLCKHKTFHSLALGNPKGGDTSQAQYHSSEWRRPHIEECSNIGDAGIGWEVADWHFSTNFRLPRRSTSY